MFVVVSYDVTSDRRRNRISRTLLDYGTRVQYSVFECNLTANQLSELEQRLLKVYDEAEDTIRIYRLCEGCFKQVEAYGKGKVTEDEEVYIV